MKGRFNMENTKRKYTLDKAIADTRIQGKLILDENQVQGINELLVELKAYRKIVRQIDSLTNNLATVTKKSLEEEIIKFNSSANQPNSPYNHQQLQGMQMMM